jgi:hypothetical protein
MIRASILWCLAVDIVLTTVNGRAGESTQPSAQQTYQSQPTLPAKNTPVTYQLQNVPPPQVPPVVQMVALQQPGIQYAPQPVAYVAQQPTYVASQPTSGTFVLGPGPLRLGAAWVGHRLTGLGKTHTWSWSHSVVAPVAPVVSPSVYVATSTVQPAVQPVVYVATAVGPYSYGTPANAVVQPTIYVATPTPAAPPQQTYQLVPVTPTAPPSVRPPDPLREAVPPPPSPQRTSGRNVDTSVRTTGR